MDKNLNSILADGNFSGNDFFPSMFSNEPYDLETVVAGIMHRIGIPANILGYNYLRRSIIRTVEYPELVHSVMKKLYPQIAEEFGTTPSRVERAIRHAIEVAWDRGDVDVLNALFGYTVRSSNGKPKNSEFIALISDRLSLRTKK